MNELRVRYNHVFGIVALVIAGFNVWLGVATGDAVNYFLAAVFLLLGLSGVLGTFVVVRPDEVEVRTPSQLVKRTHPIRGLADLRLEGNRLHRVSDGKKLATLSWFNGRTDDVEALRQALAAGGPRS